MTNRRAVLIGINHYANGSHLRGCVNDVEEMEAMLIEHFDFDDSDIRTVVDHQATQSRIRREIEGLVESTQAGDVGLLHFSGHGSRVPDLDGDEGTDGRDEILCPTDLNWASQEQLVDDWLRVQLDQVPDDANLTVFFDCCHSGTATREPPQPMAPVPRYLIHPNDLLDAESGRAPSEVRTSMLHHGRGPGDVHDVDVPEILVTGCRDHQTSADAYIAGDWRGAMSYALQRAVKRKRGTLTYRQLHEMMIDWLDGRYSQVPQLEGRGANLDRPVLRPF